MRHTILPVQNFNAHSGPINLVPLLEGKLFFTLPFPIFNLLYCSAHAVHLILWMLMTSCFTKQLLAGN